jgi:dihydrofolate synthase/folylpolyglutamate synthase
MSFVYRDALNYMYQHLPMFQRIGSAAYKANLDNTIAICNALNNPQNYFPSVHIAGTNGKGSTSHMLAAAFQSAGYKTGLYTSPHLKDFRERIKVNGKMISKKYVAQFIELHQSFFNEINPSFFEMTVGMAFQYFKDKKVDVAIIETGLGGRLDSTNVINPVVSVITNISYDHMALLGNTLPLIAKEKAGIIKSHIPVVIGESQPEVKMVFTEMAKKFNAPIYFADKHYKVIANPLSDVMQVYQHKTKYFKSIKPQLQGIYQLKNIATVLQTIEVINSNGFKINKHHAKAGIKHVVDLTGLSGRWQVLSKKPFCIADSGHNEAGIKFVLQQLKQTPHHQLHFVLGMVNDKDITKILRMLPKSAIYYFCKANIPRGLQVTELSRMASEAGLKGKTYQSVRAAYNAAKKAAAINDLVFIGGSTFTVAEVV